MEPISDKQRRYLLDLTLANKQFEIFVGGNLWEADYPDMMAFLQDKLPDSEIPNDVNDLSSQKASTLISYMKNL